MADLNRYAALAAILKELGIEFEVVGMDSRIQLQKAIYLAQVGGADLGYRFSWYVRGPYSSVLADDYYEAMRHPEVKEFTASQELKQRLVDVKAVVNAKPDKVEMAAWLEAVASLDYLWRVQRTQEADLKKVFAQEKPHLENLYEPALQSIKKLRRG